MNHSLRLCVSCTYWDGDRDRDQGGDLSGEGGDLSEGRCRRYPPVCDSAPDARSGRVRRGVWPRTAGIDWCGEWLSREAPSAGEASDLLKLAGVLPEGLRGALSEGLPGTFSGARPIVGEAPLAGEEERWLRNTSTAQALLVLPPEKRDQVLREVLTEEELEAPCPPEDFYERVQRYLAGEKGRGEI
ncbi:MAG: hypothetical protein M1274_01320 [Actinobacteria bacterium]|nr:hypothetical protein [Actinomycetota bacterium]